MSRWLHYACKSSIQGTLIDLIPCLITWCLWNWWCKARMEGKKHADQVWSHIQCQVKLIAETNNSFSNLKPPNINILNEFHIKPQDVHSRPGKLISWTKPHTAWIKLNYDGSCKGNSGNSGDGGVVRDCQRRVKATFSCHFGNCTNNSTELKAIIECIKLCKILH